ncbi:hypothetical protein ACFV0T_41290 [Streptomyces sp. NPDC059582]|uniref:hypothetical protein n=1 Tax=Streptomyces sp. NPDC059582 TaxID=3346875 RepID=UPI00368C44C1
MAPVPGVGSAFPARWTLKETLVGISPTTARREQAFSVDDGVTWLTWLTDWTMDFTRSASGTRAG